MALIMLDGFDKYGGANTTATSVTALMAGEWTTISAANIAAPLSATGQSISSAGTMTVAKTLPTLGRIIGGVRFSSNLAVNVGVQFLDGASNQVGILIAASTGIISLRNGAYQTGTVLGSSSSGVAANTTHYLEWDISFGNSAAYTVYLDGVSVISGTGDTTATTNNTISSIQLVVASGTANGTFDDFYLFDSTGTTNNAPLLTSPRIETTFPISDNAVQMSIGASVLGSTAQRGATAGGAANFWYVKPFTPSRACTLNSISVVPNTTTSANLRPVIYSDSAGLPATLMTAGSTVVGTTAGAANVMPLTSPPTLTAGTQYWLGFMTDINVTMQASDAGTGARSQAGVTFTSGAPGTAPGSSSASNVLLWGNITLASAANYYEVNQQPPPAANTSYVFDSVVGDEDLYNFANLSVIPANIYATAVKAWCARSDSGARTVSLRMKSGSTDGGGSLTGQTPGTSYGWVGSNFETDPNGSIAWTGVSLNAATSGFKIDA
jgi:hypothetical protein